MREFNTSGVCYPDLHYFVSRREVLEKTLAQIQGKPGREGTGRYFTLFAPRQTGKSTLIAEIQRKLGEEYLFLNLSVESMIDLTEEEFCALFGEDLATELKLAGLPFPTLPLRKLTKIPQLKFFFKALKDLTPKKVVMVIDEFDGLTENYLGKFLHLFREIYQKRDVVYNLHSLILIGVRNLTGVSLEHASPFNIADEIRLGRFTRAEVEDLLSQYEAETGQVFAPAVKERIYEETQGQPGLVNEVCKLLVERFNPVDYDKLQKGEIAPQPIEMPAFERMLDYFLYAHISKNVSNILNKARAEETQVLRLFDTTAKVPYKIDEPWQKYFWVNGIVDFEEEPGSAQKFVRFTCPLYQKKLYAFFKPDLDLIPEQKYYLRPGEDYRRYLREDGRLDLMAVLQNYQQYLDRRGSKAFAFARLRADGSRLEAAYHYSLDCYLASMAQMFQGRTEVEFPTGNGKVDIFLHLGPARYVIEIKNYTNEYLLTEAKRQAARYARSEGLSEAYLVVFRETEETSVPGPFQEEIEGVTLRGLFIRVGRA